MNNSISRSGSTGRRSSAARPFRRTATPTRSNSSNSFSSRSRFSNRPQRNAPRRKQTTFDVSRYISHAPVAPIVKEAYQTKHTFADFAITPELARVIEQSPYNIPTPIQDQIIPHIIEGKDVVGLANTGTGKTAAFLIPLINKVLVNPKESVIILAPTRELVIQIEQELQALTRGLRVFSVVCVGGMGINPQLRALKKHNQFIIGTPGRTKDLIQRGAIVPSHINTVVLDEADQMLDMGFIHDMRSIITQLPKEHHTLFFSATLSEEIRKLIHEFLTNPVSISVKTQETASNVTQDIVKIGGKDKSDVLIELLTKAEFSKVIVFGQTKHGVEKLSKRLIQRGFKAVSIHGNKSHGQRQQALKFFKNAQARILVATDVAARGIHVSNVSHVINFDLPATQDDYIHRIGRTGRVDKTGIALTLVP